MSNKTFTLILIIVAFLMMYLSSTSLTGLPAIICTCIAVGLTITAFVRTVREIRR